MPRCYHSISRRSGSSERAGWCIKEMGRLQEALQAYDEIIGSFSPNYFALCGRAEVLKEMERFNDARIAYEETITRFPQASIALCGRASVLEREGNLKDALQAYDQAILKFPREVVPWSGRAEVLKKLGSLQEALAAYEKVLQRYPGDPRVRFSKAAIFVAMGRYDDAEALLSPDLPQTYDEWVGYHIRGMIHLRRGNLDNAREIFETGLQGNPWSSERRYFKNALAIVNLMKRQFRESLIKLGNDPEPLTQILRIHAFGALGERENATQAFRRVESNCPGILIPLRNELANRYVFSVSGLQDSDSWVIEEECRVVLLRAA